MYINDYFEEIKILQQSSFGLLRYRLIRRLKDGLFAVLNIDLLKNKFSKDSLILQDYTFYDSLLTIFAVGDEITFFPSEIDAIENANKSVNKSLYLSTDSPSSS